MAKPPIWTRQERRREIWTAVALGWAFLGIPLALVATYIDRGLGKVVIGVVAAPILVIGAIAAMFIGLAPFFVRKPKERLIAAPISVLIGYALGDWPLAFGYLAAVLTVWAALWATGAIKGERNTATLPR